MNDFSKMKIITLIVECGKVPTVTYSFPIFSDIQEKRITDSAKNMAVEIVKVSLRHHKLTDELINDIKTPDMGIDAYLDDCFTNGNKRFRFRQIKVRIFESEVINLNTHINNEYIMNNNKI
jgi:hypothetical protein